MQTDLWVILARDEAETGLYIIGSFAVERDPLPGLKEVLRTIDPAPTRRFYAFCVSPERRIKLFEVQTAPYCHLIGDVNAP